MTKEKWLLLILALITLIAIISIPTPGIYSDQREKENTATELEDLKERIKFSKQTFDLCIENSVHLQMKYMYLDSLDTAGVSCSRVVDNMRKRYEGRIAEYETYWIWSGKKLMKIDALMNIAYEHYKVTKDTSIYNLLMDLRSQEQIDRGDTLER